jgi:hypothetical protein
MVVAGIFESPLHLNDRQRPEGVSYFGAVNSDLRDPLRLVVLDVRKLSGYLPIYASHDGKIIGFEEVVQSSRIRR